jgi:hypothetical protein
LLAVSPLKTSLVVGLLSAVVTAGALFCLHQSRVRELRRLQSQNERMRFEAYQRSAVRIAAAPPAAAPTPITVSTAPAATAVPASKAAEYYRNEGNATPLATLQTFAWACDRGDTETVGRLLHIDAAARPKVEAIMAGMPESVRIHWKNADEMAAALLTESIMARPFPRSDILETATPEPITADRVRLRMPNVPRDGTEYQQTPDGWKYVLTEKVVDSYTRQTKAKP